MHANFPHLKPIVVNPTPQNNVSTASDELLVSFLPLSKAVRPSVSVRHRQQFALLPTSYRPCLVGQVNHLLEKKSYQQKIANIK